MLLTVQLPLMRIPQRRAFTVIIFIVVLLQGCTALDSAQSDQSEIYNQNFNKMVDVVQQSIRASGLGISYSNRSDNGKKSSNGL